MNYEAYSVHFRLYNNIPTHAITHHPSIARTHTHTHTCAHAFVATGAVATGKTAPATKSDFVSPTPAVRTSNGDSGVRIGFSYPITNEGLFKQGLKSAQMYKSRSVYGWQHGCEHV